MPQRSSTALAWDIALAALLAAEAGAAYGALQLSASSDPWSGAWMLAWLIFFCAVAGLLLTLYGSFIEPHVLVTTKQRIPFPGDQSLRIAVVTDFHVGPYKGARFVARVVERVNALAPDIVVMPGDFIYDEAALLSALEPLKDLRAPLGVFATLGNHDYGLHGSLFDPRFRGIDRSSEVTAMLMSHNVTVLENEHRVVTHDGQRIVVAGVKDTWVADANVALALKDADPALPVILLSHNPEIILDEATRHVHIVISCHTHGGQLRLPFIGPIGPVPTKLGRAYDQGIFPFGDHGHLVITRGVGESSPRARLFAPPEIMLLTTK